MLTTNKEKGKAAGASPQTPLQWRRSNKKSDTADRVGEGGVGGGGGVLSVLDPIRKARGGGVLSVLGLIRKAGGGEGGGVLSVLRPMRKAGGRGRCCLLQVRYEKCGGGAACRTMIFVCARVRDSTWRVERGGGGGGGAAIGPRGRHFI